LDFVHKKFPEEAKKLNVIVGKPGEYSFKDPAMYKVDNSKSIKEVSAPPPKLGLGFSIFSFFSSSLVSNHFTSYSLLPQLGLKYREWDETFSEMISQMFKLHQEGK